MNADDFRKRQNFRDRNETNDFQRWGEGGNIQHKGMKEFSWIMNIYLYISVKTHHTLGFKRVTLMLCKLYLNEPDFHMVCDHSSVVQNLSWWLVGVSNGRKDQGEFLQMEHERHHGKRERGDVEAKGRKRRREMQWGGAPEDKGISEETKRC